VLGRFLRRGDVVPFPSSQPAHTLRVKRLVKHRHKPIYDSEIGTLAPSHFRKGAVSNILYP